MASFIILLQHDYIWGGGGVESFSHLYLQRENFDPHHLNVIKEKTWVQQLYGVSIELFFLQTNLQTYLWWTFLKEYNL